MCQSTVSSCKKNGYSGSLKELCLISFPLILSLMSSSLMFFADRLFLANFSLEAHNAAASSGNVVSFLQFPFICTACIAEVFVGQCYGAGEKHKIGSFIWQVIWLSVFSTLFFIPLGYYAGDFLFAGSRYYALEVDYYRYLMYCGPVFCLGAGISAFYIGQGSLFFITVVTIIANILNAILACILIFGWAPYFEPQGVAGAALATVISQGLLTAVMFIDFLRKRNRIQYGTGFSAFCWDKFSACLRLGFPASIAHTIEILAWALFFRMLMGVSDEHIAVASIAQTILFLFTFITEGISKGAMVVASNMIGARQWQRIWRLLLSGLKFYAIAFILLSFFFIIKPSFLIQLFLPEAEVAGGTLHSLVASSCVWIWFFFLFDGIHWLVVGLLTAAGDTKFVLKIGSTMIWLFALLPTYLLIVRGGLSADFAWAISTLYALAICFVYLCRFYNERWKENLVLSPCAA